MSETTLDHSSSIVSPRPLLIGSAAPRFTARTTMGERSLDDYRGRWLVFFSHPADFTPVCTSEFLTFSRLFPEFQKLDCDLLALSVDSLFSHIAWIRSIKERFGIAVPFPILEDPSMAIAAAYGMIHPEAGDASTVRANFVIDPDGIVRAIGWYPMSVGRSVPEILRAVQALQTADRQNAWTPEGWQPGDDLLEPAPLTFDPETDIATESSNATDWYYRLRTS